ncbi:peptidoglycan-binding protein LysM [Silvimonas amylolytica]|uniref:Peptidoglycan-binding protein LysM n=2 Tax=Silvimonas amylolytica TaxID=449663 RepID=A0ABQ2PQL7_9NEIS|nr:peptidoglycan-binding protein LysM [Silvimonas amylolytica]
MTFSAAPAFSAALGPIQVRSALGERLDAVIQVNTATSEELTSSCFKVGTPQQDEEGVVLRGVQMTWEPQGGGAGRLHLRTTDPVTEPVVRLPLQVKCSNDDTRDFQRDYTLLLDPRDYRGAVASPDLPSATAANALPGNTTRSGKRKLPALGSTWTVRAGDNVDTIASSYYPRSDASRKQFIADLYAQNPDLPQGYRVPLPVDTQLTLPPKVTMAAPAGEAAPPRPPKTTRKAAPNEGRSVLRLDDSPPETPSPSTASAPAVAAIANQAASEDQQLALLKTQIAQLQQELAQLKLQAQQQLATPGAAPATAVTSTNTAPAVPATAVHPHAPVHAVAPPEPEKSGSILDWLLFPLIVLVVALALIWSYWRWKVRQRAAQAAEEDYALQFADGFEADEHSDTSPTAGVAARGSAAPVPVVRPEPSRELATNINQIANEWQNSTMDVVQPGNVSEEAQLLLDHGLLQQAINLLTQEIEQHPALAALWLKLLSIYSQHHMKADFLTCAMQFHEQFTDESLWRQVQVMGADVDPENPLYQLSEEEAASLPDYRKESALKHSIGGTLPDEHLATPSAQGDAEFASLMREQAGLEPTDSEWTLSEEHEALPRNALAGHVPFDTRLPEPLPAHAESEVPHDALFGNELEFDLDALPPLEAPVLRPSAPVPAPVEVVEASAPAASAAPQPAPSEFRTDDPHMQKIAFMLEHGQEGEALRALEEMLYSGSGVQRQLALKWLGKLQPRAFDK